MLRCCFFCLIFVVLSSLSKVEAFENPLITATEPNGLLDSLTAEAEQPRFIPTSFWASMGWQRTVTTNEVQQDPVVRSAATNFERFCHTVAAQPQMNYSKPPLGASIPPQIHFIWLGTPVPPEVDAVIHSWKAQHPGWGIRVWTEKEADQILATTPRLLKAFYSADSWAEKSDILRLQILYEIGGIYADADAVCLKPFHEVTSQGFTFVGGIEMNCIWKPAPGNERRVPLCMGSAVMAAAPGSPVIKYCLDHYRTKEEAPSLSLVMRAGPGLVLCKQNSCGNFCVKAPGFNDRKASCIALIQRALRSLNRGSFHAKNFTKNFVYRALVGRACYAALLSPEEQDKVLVLPCSYLFPFPFENKAAFNELEDTMLPPEKVRSLASMAKEYIAPESLAVHLWVGSWVPDEVQHQLMDFFRSQFFGLDEKKNSTQ